MKPQSMDLFAYLAVLRRRRTVILFVAGGGIIVSLLLAWLLPPVYRSTATILIEEQEIPSDLVRSTITSYADQRIETIKQQVLSRTTLWKLVEQHNLYAQLREQEPSEEILRRFSRDISVEVINADVVDKRTQHPTKATIAFTLAYSGSSPETTQKVANELTTLFLAENLRSRERKAQETTNFLRQEADNISRHIEEIEGKIAAVKQRANGALPELTQLNMQLLNQADRELVDLEREIRAQEDRHSYLDAQLTTIKPNTPIIASTGERILDSSERLKTLRAQYAGNSAYLSPEHPDIIKLQQEIEALEREVGEVDLGADVAKHLAGEQATLATLLKRYGPDHPDVKRTQGVIAALRQQASRSPRTPLRGQDIKPENPAYITIHAQLSASKATLDALKSSRKDLKRRVEDYAARLERTPQIEPEYVELARDRDSSVSKYHEIRSRLMEAQVSEGLEIQRKGERFSLIDPPDVPVKPDKPNRPVIVFLGLIFSIAAGAGSGALAEQLDRSIHSADQIRRLTQASPLAIIPYIPNHEDLRTAIRHQQRLRWGTVGAGLLSLLLVHALWLPLDVMWFALLRKLGIE